MKLDIEQLEFYRMSLMLNQGELAQKADISQATLSTLKNRGTCSKATLKKIARALEVDPTELLLKAKEV